MKSARWNWIGTTIALILATSIQSFEVNMKAIFTVAIVAMAMEISLCASHAESRQSLPAALSQRLSVRDQKLSHVTFEWEMQSHVTTPRRSAKELASEDEVAATAMQHRMKRYGASDREIAEAIVKAKREIASDGAGHQVDGQDAFRIDRYDEKTLVTGSRTKIGFVEDCRQYYQASDALFVEDKVEAPVKNMALDFSIVWSSQGQSVMNRDPSQSYLNLTPEHFALLTGLNPLSMESASWRVVAVNKDTAHLAANVDTANGPLEINVLLSGKYDWAPVSIDIREPHAPWLISIRVTSLENYQNTWISKTITLRRYFPDAIDAKEVWTLNTVQPLDALGPPTDIHRQVQDYRLLGNDVSTREVQIPTDAVSKQIANYTWPGRFLPLDELRKTIDAP